jgi:hypothetical protein
MQQPNDGRQLLITLPSYELIYEMSRILPFKCILGKDIRINDVPIKNVFEFDKEIPLSVENFEKIRSRIFVTKSNDIKKIKIIKQDVCTICMDAPASAMLECGHECFCNECSNMYSKRECPICREKINTIFYLE